MIQQNREHAITDTTTRRHKIPFVDLSIQNKAIVSKWLDEAANLIDTNCLIKGDPVAEFEKDFAFFNHCYHCVGVASGTDALLLALLACGVGEGDEVITVSHSFVATAEAISMVGAKPVFVDIVDHFFTMDAGQLASAMTQKTKAIIPVHLYGQCADMEPILEFAAANNLYVIEDACQAHGATYRGKYAGSMGDLGCFSFYPTKNLGALGDAGAVITNNPQLADRIRQYADHGQSKRYHHNRKGMNSRLDTLQATALRLKLRKLKEWNHQRRMIAKKYDELLVGTVKTPAVKENNEHVYHLYVIETDRRDKLHDYLLEQGIATMIHYPIPIHKQVAFSKEFLSQNNKALSRTEKSVDRILSLPLYLGIDDAAIGYIADAVSNFMMT